MIMVGNKVMAKGWFQPIYICLRIEWGTKEKKLLGPIRAFLSARIERNKFIMNFIIMIYNLKQIIEKFWGGFLIFQKVLIHVLKFMWYFHFD